MPVSLEHNMGRKTLATSLKEGQLAIITDWPVDMYIDRLVQRWGNHLIAIGLPSSQGWPDFFVSDHPSPGRLRVRVVENQAKLVVWGQ